MNYNPLKMKNVVFLLIIFSTFNLFSQDFELRKTPPINSKIIYLDGTSEEGMLWMANSAFNPRLKTDKNWKSRKLDYKTIDKIITNPEAENERIFQYLNHNYSKYKIFVELIYEDVLSIYIGSNDSDDLFYSDINRQSMGELMAQMRFEGVNYSQKLKLSDTIELPYGKKLIRPYRYTYYYGLNSGMATGVTPTYHYYLLKDSTLLKVEKTKRFLKKSKEYFQDCPAIITDLEQNIISLKKLDVFIEYYKDICGLENTIKN